jgi:CO/xanthine dehydrogenase FAD-binding subunit
LVIAIEAAPTLSPSFEICTAAAAVKAAVTAMLGDIDPTEDNRGPVAFKRHAAGIVLGRAIARAWSRA